MAWFRVTLEKEAELEIMRSKKRQERDFFKKMENGELNPKDEEKKQPKLLVGKLKDVVSTLTNSSVGYKEYTLHTERR